MVNSWISDSYYNSGIFAVYVIFLNKSYLNLKWKIKIKLR